MTGSEPTTSQVAIFIADWFIRNNTENIHGDPAAGADRLREAVEAAFPKVSQATVDAALQEIKAMLNG